MKTLKLGQLKEKYLKDYATYKELAHAHLELVKVRKKVGALRKQLQHSDEFTYKDYIKCLPNVARGSYGVNKTKVFTTAGLPRGTLLMSANEVVERNFWTDRLTTQNVWIDAVASMDMYQHGVHKIECEALEWEMLWRCASRAKAHMLVGKRDGYITFVEVGQRDRKTKRMKSRGTHVEAFGPMADTTPPKFAIEDAWVIIDHYNHLTWVNKEAPLDIEAIKDNYTKAQLIGVSTAELRRKV